MINSGSKGFLGGTSDVANPYSGGGAQNAAKSLGSIGRALSQMGADGFAIAQDLQAANNAKLENDTINHWEEAFGKHEAETMGNKDPQDRIEKMDNLIHTLKEDGFKGKSMPPVVRDRLEAKWGRVATKYRNRALSQSAQLMEEQSMTAFGNRLDRAQSMDEVNEVLADGVEQQRISLPQSEKIAFKMGNDFEFRDLESLAENDPELALDNISNGSTISQGKKRHIERKAKARIQALHQDEYDYYVGRIEDGELVDADEIESIQGGRMNPRDKESLKKHLLNERGPSEEQVEDAMQIMDELADMKKSGASEVEIAKQYMKAERFVRSVTPKGHSGWLRQRLNYHNPNYKGGAKSPSHNKTELKEFMRENISFGRKNKMFGSDEGAALKSSQRLKEKTLKWIDEHPQGTSEELEKYMNGALHGVTILGSLRGSAPTLNAPPSSGLLPKKGTLEDFNSFIQ